MTVADKEKVVLLVEDNPADERLAKEALASSRNGRVRTVSVSDGEQAILFLTRRGAYREAPLPDLVLLDLGLPNRGGEEVLEAVRSSAATRNTPVVVFTGSATSQVTEKCYALGANCVVPKASNLDEHLHALDLICAFWLSAVKLPGGSRM